MVGKPDRRGPARRSQGCRMDAWIVARLGELPEGQTQLTLAFAVFLGLLYCFFGYTLLRLLLGLTGFLLAGTVAALLAAYASGGQWMVSVPVGLFGGLCGAMALIFLFRLAVFGIGMAGAGVVAFEFVASRPEPWAPWAALGLALLGGICAVLLERTVMAIATAALGGWLASRSGSVLLVNGLLRDQADAPGFDTQIFWGEVAVWGILAVLGAGFQVFMRRRKG